MFSKNRGLWHTCLVYTLASSWFLSTSVSQCVAQCSVLWSVLFRTTHFSSVWSSLITRRALKHAEVASYDNPIGSISTLISEKRPSVLSEIVPLITIDNSSLSNWISFSELVTELECPTPLMTLINKIRVCLHLTSEPVNSGDVTSVCVCFSKASSTA